MPPLARPDRILTAAIAVTFLVMRAYLHWSPNTDFDVGGYNVHHLFSGVLLIAVCGIPAVSVPLSPRARAIAIAGFGAGLAMALDEWVYLIATDGTNAAYVQPLSLISGALMVGLACGYALALGHGCRGTPRA
jgi:hypothetical protein